MIYCKKCGVELDVGMSRCPLCGKSVSRHAGGTAAEQEEDDPAMSTGHKWDLQRIRRRIIQAIPSLKRIFHT